MIAKVEHISYIYHISGTHQTHATNRPREGQVWGVLGEFKIGLWTFGRKCYKVITSRFNFQPLSYQMVLVISGSKTFLIIYHFLEGGYSTIDVFGRVGYRVTDNLGFQTWEQNIRGKARLMHSMAGSVYVPQSTWMGVVTRRMDGCGCGVATLETDGWVWSEYVGKNG